MEYEPYKHIFKFSTNHILAKAYTFCRMGHHSIILSLSLFRTEIHYSNHIEKLEICEQYKPERWKILHVFSIYLYIGVVAHILAGDIFWENIHILKKKFLKHNEFVNCKPITEVWTSLWNYQLTIFFQNKAKWNGKTRPDNLRSVVLI